MLNDWLDDWSAKLDEIEKDSQKDELMQIELLEKYTSFMMRLMQIPSKIFDLGFKNKQA
tara:strand:- start:483 stop:659 length:177 start_codon:yes stop_codon:yes gene_type:complete